MASWSKGNLQSADTGSTQCFMGSSLCDLLTFLRVCCSRLLHSPLQSGLGFKATGCVCPGPVLPLIQGVSSRVEVVSAIFPFPLSLPRKTSPFPLRHLGQVSPSASSETLCRTLQPSERKRNQMKASEPIEVQ